MSSSGHTDCMSILVVTSLSQHVFCLMCNSPISSNEQLHKRNVQFNLRSDISENDLKEAYILRFILNHSNHFIAIKC